MPHVCCICSSFAGCEKRERTRIWCGPLWYIRTYAFMKSWPSFILFCSTGVPPDCRLQLFQVSTPILTSWRSWSLARRLLPKSSLVLLMYSHAFLFLTLSWNIFVWNILFISYLPICISLLSLVGKISCALFLQKISVIYFAIFMLWVLGC